MKLLIQCSKLLSKQIFLIELIKVNNQHGRESTKKTPKTVGDLRDQIDEENTSKIQSHRLDIFNLMIITFYCSVAEK